MFENGLGIYSEGEIAGKISSNYGERLMYSRYNFVKQFLS